MKQRKNISNMKFKRLNIFYKIAAAPGLAAFFLLCNCTGGQIGKKQSAIFKNGMVVSAHHEASKVGLEILKSGGNSIDAAIAVQFALAVVYPNAGNIGGGGFMVYRTAAKEYFTLDFREKAAQKAHRNMYLDRTGNPIKEKSITGYLAAGVPGSVAGMWAAHQKFGKLKWEKLLKPAIKLAENGFKVTEKQANELNKMDSAFRALNVGYNYLVKNSEWKAGEILQQPDLGKTLTLIADNGCDGFYKGETADLLLKEMQRNGGIITKTDLENYKAIWRKPLTGNYKNYKIITMPPPSSGGVALLQLLKMVESYPLKRFGYQTDSTIQLITETERRVYADRTKHLGDPDFTNVPINQLINPAYLINRMQDFNWDKATLSTQILAGNFTTKESEETTHFSIVDNEGNAVSITTTLNGSYGAKVFVKGAGFLLNNEMDDFSVKPGSPNMYGLIGGEANAIAPGKRMLSSMTPTIIEKDGNLYLVLGTPGGSTIITSVFQTVLNILEFDKNVQAAVNAKRFHHQWLPDEILMEKDAIDSLTKIKLQLKGFKFVQRGTIGRVDAILKNKWGYLEGGADPRGDDTKVGY